MSIAIVVVVISRCTIAIVIIVVAPHTAAIIIDFVARCAVAIVVVTCCTVTILPKMCRMNLSGRNTCGQGIGEASGHGWRRPWFP